MESDTPANNVGLSSASVVPVVLSKILEEAFNTIPSLDPNQDKFDRPRLFAEFDLLNKARSSALRKNVLLNRKYAEHFRKKKKLDVFAEEAAAKLPELQDKYQNYLLQLENLQHEGKIIHERAQQVINPLKMEIEAKTEELNQNTDFYMKNLADFGKKNIKNQAANFDDDLKTKLARMRTLRENLYAARLLLIAEQNHVKELDEKLLLQEDVGEGLKINDFEQLRAENVILTDKIEERNNELSRFREKCGAKTKITAHNREKNCELMELIQKEKDKMSMLKILAYEVRRDASSLHKQRNILKDELEQLNDDCGLLTQTFLLKDFDATVKKTAVIKKQIVEIEQDNNRLQSEREALIRSFQAN